MLPLKSEFLFHLALTVAPEPHPIGAGPLGTRRVTGITGGTCVGPRIQGTAVPGASAAWVLIGADETIRLEVRVTLRTDDGAWIYMHYPGIAYGSRETMQRVNTGRAVEPGAYYFRTVAQFETAAPRYDWLNRVFAVGVGERATDGPRYDVYEIL
jgi:hypothetical protein